jgi:hypothetical protein
MNAVQNVTFNAYNNVEEAKPLLYGFVLQLLVATALTSIFAGIAVVIVAAAVQAGVQNNAAKAKETLLWGSIIPTFVALVFILPAIAGKFGPSIANLFA